MEFWGDPAWEKNPILSPKFHLQPGLGPALEPLPLRQQPDMQSSSVTAPLSLPGGTRGTSGWGRHPGTASHGAPRIPWEFPGICHLKLNFVEFKCCFGFSLVISVLVATEVCAAAENPA